MVTLTMMLVATAIVMVLALVFGVWMARSARADLVIRPVLDAAQTIPPFVYLLPALALFGPGRFAAITAAVVYSAPVAIKLVTDGIRGVPETTLEAARSTGTSRWQEIRKVQIPMARGSLVLAANQGLLYVLVDGRHRRPRRCRSPRVRRGAGRLAQRGVGQGHGRGHLDRAAGHHARPHHARGRPGEGRPARRREEMTRLDPFRDPCEARRRQT